MSSKQSKHIVMPLATSPQVRSSGLSPNAPFFTSTRRPLAMIFLKDNVLMERELTPDDIKPHLLGHWGTCPSHINAETPGCIHEGGELGYALSVSFGAVMDKPDLIVACVVGDGEAETGPTATYIPRNYSLLAADSKFGRAWHSYKYIDPGESGAVIPIVHVNGFKICERTIYGTMEDNDLVDL